MAAALQGGGSGRPCVAALLLQASVSWVQWLMHIQHVLIMF